MRLNPGSDAVGHVSIQATEKYLGIQQNLVEAVNDKLDRGCGVLK